MKNIIIAAALAITSISVNAKNKTAGNKVNYKVEQSFQKEFKGAGNVQWSVSSDNMLRASFTTENGNTNAFFTEEGELIASTIVLSASQLPAQLKSAFDTKYAGATILEAILLQTDNEEAYFVKLAIGGQEKLIKGYENGSIRQVSEKQPF